MDARRRRRLRVCVSTVAVTVPMQDYAPLKGCRLMMQDCVCRPTPHHKHSLMPWGPESWASLARMHAIRLQVHTHTRPGPKHPPSALTREVRTAASQQQVHSAAAAPCTPLLRLCKCSSNKAINTKSACLSLHPPPPTTGTWPKSTQRNQREPLLSTASTCWGWLPHQAYACLGTAYTRGPCTRLGGCCGCQPGC